MKWDGWKEIKIDDDWSIIYLPWDQYENVFLILCKHRNANCKQCSTPDHIWKMKQTLQKMQSL